MKLDDIKQEALLFKARNISELSDKIKELKDKEAPFLGLVYFMQHNQQLSLSEARKKLWSWIFGLKMKKQKYRVTMI